LTSAIREKRKGKGGATRNRKFIAAPVFSRKEEQRRETSFSLSQTKGGNHREKYPSYMTASARKEGGRKENPFLLCNSRKEKEGLASF